MAKVLRNLSDALAATVEATGPAVVRVEGRRRLPASGIVWSADGIIVTTHHVVQRDEKIGVGLPDGKTVQATLVGRDPTTDLAVLRAQTEGLTPPTWADLESLQGTWSWPWGGPDKLSRPRWASSAPWATVGARRPAAAWTATYKQTW